MTFSSLLAPFRHPVTRTVRRIVRRIVVVVAVIIAVALVTTISVDVGPALKSLAETQGSRYIERPMHIGRLEARLWDGAYIVHDLRIDGLTPEGIPFLTAKRIVVSMPWSTLFNRRVVFDSIEMIDWRMHVETLADGRHNFPRFTRERKGPRSVWTTTLQYVRAYRGEFTYQDFGTPWGIVTRHLDVTVTKLGTDYRGTARFADGLVAIQNYLPFRADMTSNFKIDGGRVIFGRIDLATEGAKTVLVGDANLSFWPELMFSMKSTIDFPKMREIFFPGDSFRLSGTSDFNGIFHLFKEPIGNGQTRTGRELRGEFHSALAGINRYRFDNLRGMVRWTPEYLEVTDASAGAYGGTSRFTYKMAPLNAKNVPATATFDAKYENVDLASISDLFELEGIRFAGRISGRNLLQWPLRNYAQHTGVGEVHATAPEGAPVMTREMPMRRIAAREARGPEMGPFSPLTPFEPVPVAGEIVYSYGPEWVEVSSARLATGSTYVEMQGRTKYGPESRFPFHVSSADWQESDRLFAGILTAFGSKTGAIAIGGYGTFDGVMTGEFKRPRIQGEFRGEKILAFNVVWGSVRGTSVIENSYADVKDVVITQAESVIKTTGRYSLGFPRKDGGPEIDAHIEIVNRPAADLRHAFKIDEYQIDGTLSGDFDLNGEYLKPHGGGKMQIVNGTIYGETIDSATTNVRLEGEGARMENVRIAKSGGEGNGNAYLGWNGTYAFTFDARNVPVESVSAAKALQLPIVGTLSLKSGGSGSFESPKYEAQLTLRDVFVADEGIGDVTGNLQVSGDLLTIQQLTAISRRLNISGSGQIALDEQHDAKLHFDVVNTALDPYVRVYLPKLSPFTTAVVTGSLDVRGELNDIDHLLVDATVDRVEMALFDYQLHNARPIRIALDRHAVDIKDMRLEGQETQLDITGRVNLHDESVSVRANGDANLAVLQGFISNIKSQGSATLAATLDGPLKNPNASGQLTITKGRIRHFALPHALEDINGPLQFDTRGINLDGLTGRLARGDVRFSGRINKEGYLPGRLDVHMTGTDMQLRFPEGMRSSLVDANLDLTGTVEDATLSGLVNIKDALYTKSFDPTGSFFNFGRGETPAPAPPPADTTTLPLRYQVRITAPGTLQVRNNTLRLVAEADLELQGTYDKPIIIGRVEVQNGDATVFAKKFVLTRATVDFNNPTRIEPFFDIEAEARIRVPGETYRVTVRAAGPPDRLRNLSFQSDPPLPEADVMALVFSDIAPGGNVELAYYRNSSTPQVQLAQEQAARALTGMLGANEVNRAAEKALGVDTFQITPSLNDPQSSRLEPGARVTLLKRVSDRVSITYSRSLAATATRDQIIVLEYDQTDQFSWILSRNEDGTYALDWQVRKTF